MEVIYVYGKKTGKTHCCVPYGKTVVHIEVYTKEKMRVLMAGYPMKINREYTLTVYSHTLMRFNNLQKNITQS